jgi:hypothetical protein
MSEGFARCKFAVYELSLGARFSIRSVILSRSLADAFSAIHGLHLRLIVIMSPVIRSRHRNSGGIGEYTRSFPQVGQRIIKKERSAMGKGCYLGRMRIDVPSTLTS